jgi:tetratricopeptide (TPR) repeat protein
MAALGLGGLVGVISPNPAGLGIPAQAQTLRPEVRDPFLADPLADNPRDPLLPTPLVDRPLSPLEQYTLEQDLNQLAREAEALAEADEPEAAKELWMREVRLRRVLGIPAELEAIDRVAQWLRDTSATQELQLLSARLDQILPTLDPAQPQDREQLEAMANAYTTLGNVETAATLRRTLANAALDRGDRDEHRAQLEALVVLYADWFYFPEAAATYSELVALIQAEGEESDEELNFWVRQIENLEFAQQFQSALEAQQQLLLRYRSEEALWPRMAALQYAMAQNHQRLGDVETASRQYQIAYTNAIGSQQLEVAAQTLNALASLYRQLEQWPDVDYLYQQLLTVERQALDAYGLMETFDQIGQLYEQSGNLDGARQAYQEGLALAKQINHRQDYFATQVDRLSLAPSP